MDEQLHLLKYFPLSLTTGGSTAGPSVTDSSATAGSKTLFTPKVVDESRASASAPPHIYSYDDSLWATSKNSRQILREYASTKEYGKWDVVLSITTAAELGILADNNLASELLEGVDGISLDETLCNSETERCVTVYRQLHQSHSALTWFIPARDAEVFFGTTSKPNQPIIPILAPDSAINLSQESPTDTLATPLGLGSREFSRSNTPPAAAEIAFLLHLGVSGLYQREAAGWDERTPLSVYFELSATPDIFAQVVKMRSLMILWELVIQELGLHPKSVDTRLMVHCGGSNCAGSNSDKEPHKALLATICESIGAIMGGATHVIIAGSDHSSLEATIRSLRLARNVQLIARYESRIGDIIDPVGGSWYAEDLTRSVMASAWELFQSSQSQSSQSQTSQSQSSAKDLGQ